MNRTLDDIIAGQGQGGRAPRSGGASTSQRSQPYGRTGRGGRQQQQQSGHNEEEDVGRERISDSLDSTATPANAIKVGATQVQTRAGPVGWWEPATRWLRAPLTS